MLFLRGPMTLGMIADSRADLAEKSIVSYAYPSNLPAANYRLTQSV